MAVAIDRAEGLLAVDADEATVLVVRPGVIRAGEASGRPATGVDDGRTSMAADIEERPGHAVGATDDEHRHPEGVERLVGAGLTELAAQGEAERGALEDEVDLVLPAGRVGVAGDGDGRDVVRLIGGAVLVVGQHPLGQRHELGSFQHRHPCAHEAVTLRATAG